MEPAHKTLLHTLLRWVLCLAPLTLVGYTAAKLHKPKGNLFQYPIRLPGDPIPLGNGTQIQIVEPYEVKALILATKPYGDQNGDIAPVDLALAWGKITDPKLAAEINIHQSNRFYYWTTPPNSPLSSSDVISLTANTHMVANSQELTTTLLALRRGDLVVLRGNLVNIHRNKQTWKSSRSRTDTGAGACEIFLPKEITVLERNLL